MGDREGGCSNLRQGVPGRLVLGLGWLGMLKFEEERRVGEWVR